MEPLAGSASSGPGVGGERPVGAAFFGIHVFHFHRGAEDDLVTAQLVQVDHLVKSHAGLDILDARFRHALAFAGGIITGVFAQVAFFTGLLDGLDDGGAFALQAGQLFFQTLVALLGNGDIGHGHDTPLFVR